MGSARRSGSRRAVVGAAFAACALACVGCDVIIGLQTPVPDGDARSPAAAAIPPEAASLASDDASATTDATNDGALDASASTAAAEASATDAGATTSPDGSSGACGGTYSGSLTGSFWSPLVVGIPVPITSTSLTMTLVPAASAGAACSSDSDAADCDDSFVVQGGSVTGVANSSSTVGDASVGGFPFACTLAGALDCPTGAFTGGWIECIYCVGPIANGGTACSITGGGFAGTLTATYDTVTRAFLAGQWNASEALAGNDGGSPGPEGGPASGYLLDSGSYGVDEYGGSGAWSATHGVDPGSYQ